MHNQSPAKKKENERTANRASFVPNTAFSNFPPLSFRFLPSLGPDLDFWCRLTPGGSAVPGTTLAILFAPKYDLFMQNSSDSTRPSDGSTADEMEAPLSVVDFTEDNAQAAAAVSLHVATNFIFNTRKVVRVSAEECVLLFYCGEVRSR
jgi:hypothetical protein